jgi:hypothetical protein
VQTRFSVMNLSSATSMTSVLAEGRVQREKQAQERAEARLRDARSAVETLKQRNTAAAKDAQEQRKAAAKQKIEQIKARIRMLQMSGSADPKLLAQLAKELKSAVKMYGGSGGASVEIGGADAGSSAASNAAPAAAADPSAGATETAPTETPIAAEPPAPPANEDAAAPKGEGEGEKNPETTKSEDNPYRRMAAEAQARVAEQSRRGAAQQEDRDFLSDASTPTKRRRLQPRPCGRSRAPAAIWARPGSP